MGTKKIATVAELAVAATIALLYLYTAFYLSNIFSWEAKIPEHDLTLSISGVILFIIAYFVLSRTPKYHDFISAVVDEFTRVTWPGSTEVRVATVVVSIFIIACGVLWGACDLLINRVIAAIVGI